MYETIKTTHKFKIVAVYDGIFLKTILEKEVFFGQSVFCAIGTIYECFNRLPFIYMNEFNYLAPVSLDYIKYDNNKNRTDQVYMQSICMDTVIYVNYQKLDAYFESVEDIQSHLFQYGDDSLADKVVGLSDDIVKIGNIFNRIKNFPKTLYSRGIYRDRSIKKRAINRILPISTRNSLKRLICKEEF